MQNNLVVPRTGLEPARLSTLAPETSASTIPPPGQLPLSGKRGSNSRPQPWQGCALPTELFPRLIYASFCKLKFKISKRAENEARTRDPNLGKVVLYQLSYFRIISNCSSVSLSLAKVGTLVVLRQGCALPTELFPHCVSLNGCKGSTNF